MVFLADSQLSAEPAFYQTGEKTPTVLDVRELYPLNVSLHALFSFILVQEDILLSFSLFFIFLPSSTFAYSLSASHALLSMS